MAENKTQENNLSVEEFLNTVENEQKRKDCFAVLNLMKKITQSEPKMWGTSIVGFGKYHYKYESGREGDFLLTGFSPRKQNLTLYVMSGFENYENLMSQLGKYKTGKSCLYVKKLEDIRQDILEDLIRQSIEYIQKMYPNV